MDISSSTVTITSYNAHSLNSANYQAKFPLGTALMSESEPSYVDRLDNYPIDGKTKLHARTLPLFVIVKGSGTIDTLKQWFEEGRMTAKKLLVTDSSDGDSWYVYAKFKSIVKRRGSDDICDVILAVADPVWTRGSATAEGWTVTTSGATNDIGVLGTAPARPVITVTPRGANPNLYAYKRFVTVTNNEDKNLVNYPLNITGGNFNHQSLVSAGKAQADGDDFRCIYDGSDHDLWTGGGGWNSTTLRPWVNVNLKPKMHVTALGAIAGAGAVSTITVQPTADNIATLLEMRRTLGLNKLLKIDSELFSFTGITVTKNECEFTGCARQARGSSAAAHSAGATIKWVEHNIWLYYGLSTATAPTVAAAREPMLDRTNSTNTSWVWTSFYDPAYPGRPASWKKSGKSKNTTGNTPTEHYGANHATNTDFNAIASEMGISLKSYYHYVWMQDIAEMEWRIYIPPGVTTVTADGEKYRVGAAWAQFCGLKVSNNGVNWIQTWNDVTPGSASTWTALAAHSAVALGDTYRILRFVMDGITAASANALNHVEYDNVTMALNSSNVPTVDLGAEQANYHINMRIKNTTTSEYIDLVLPGGIDSAVTIDCEAKTITDAEGVNMLGALSYGPDLVRKDWLTLDPTQGGGTNTIQVTETGLTDVDIQFAYSARSL